MRNRRTLPAILYVLTLLLASSCSTTKHVPEDDQLFVGLTKIQYENYQPGDHFTQTQEEIEAALATAPNGALFGSSYYRTPFPYGLWIWNWAYGSSGKLKQWMNSSFGKAPVLMSTVNPTLRASVARSVLRKNGYLHGNVTFTEVPQKNKKKMKIGYTVSLDTLFTIDTLAYVNYPADMQQLIDSTRSASAIDSGVPFAAGLLDSERSRVSQLMRNNGYYYYQPGYASYLADTLMNPCHAQLRVLLADSLPADVLRRWYIGQRVVSLQRSFMERPTDTLQQRGLTIVYSGKHPPLRQRIIRRDLRLRTGQPFSYEKYAESIQKFNATGLFSSTDFSFTPRPGTDTLDLRLSCTLDKPLDFYIETNVVNRTIGRFGPTVKVGVTRRNLFRGAEKLDINLHGSYEWQRGGGGSDMNSYQYGADASIEFPRIIFPRFSSTENRREAALRRIRQQRPMFYATPWTVAKVSTDIVHRPKYYKMHIVTGEWTYRWQPSATSRHEFSPLTVKYQFMNSSTSDFEQLIESNPYLAISMSDYFIPKMRYTYTYASQPTLLAPIRWETTIEESGHVSSLYFLAKGRSWNEKDTKMFRNPYSQFVQVETDLTKTWPTGQHSQLVAHLNAGYLHYYGNSTAAPFSEMFYVGGANSLRAFTVRSIGPGGFPLLTDDRSSNRMLSYVLRNGNLKLVGNLEYRCRLFGSLQGALFLDAGNVWLTRNGTLPKMDIDDFLDDIENIEDVDQEQVIAALAAYWWNDAVDKAKFRPSRFLSQIATGVGLGLRYDLDFFVVRLDWGFGLHLPYDTGKSGYFNISRFSDMHSLHLAIGYPF